MRTSSKEKKLGVITVRGCIVGGEPVAPFKQLKLVEADARILVNTNRAVIDDEDGREIAREMAEQAAAKDEANAAGGRKIRFEAKDEAKDEAKAEAKAK